MKTTITKQPANTLFDFMNECNKTQKHHTVIIVFKQENFNTEYSELERSYRTHSDQWGWDYSKMGRCRLGSCLDGIDNNVRLDAYNWSVEYWYIED